MTSGTTKCTWLNAICAYTSEGTVADAKSDTARRIYSGKANVVFLSPGLVTKKGRYRKILTSAAYTGRIVGFIVDEVHCVEHWGLDFRPEYRLLSTCRALLGYRVPCGGFTATLTPEDQRAVTSLLGMTAVKLVQVSPDRPNIFLRCDPFDHLVDEPALFAPLIQELLQQVGRTHKLLIYVKDKTRAERYWHYLLEESVNACREYGALLVDLVSGDLSPEQVKAATDKFLDFQCLTRVLISSEVLGMGVDIKGLYRVWVIGHFGTLKEYVCHTSYTESYYPFVLTFTYLCCTGSHNCSADAAEMVTHPRLPCSLHQTAAFLYVTQARENSAQLDLVSE